MVIPPLGDGDPVYAYRLGYLDIGIPRDQQVDCILLLDREVLPFVAICSIRHVPTTFQASVATWEVLFRRLACRPLLTSRGPPRQLSFFILSVSGAICRCRSQQPFVRQSLGEAGREVPFWEYRERFVSPNVSTTRSPDHRQDAGLHRVGQVVPPLDDELQIGVNRERFSLNGAAYSALAF